MTAAMAYVVQLPRAARLPLAGCGLLVAGLALAGQFSGLPSVPVAGEPAWVVAYAGRQSAAGSLGVIGAVAEGAAERVARVNAELAAMTRSETLLVARDDGLINLETLGLASREAGGGPQLRPVPFSAQRITGVDLRGVDAVLSRESARRRTQF